MDNIGGDDGGYYTELQVSSTMTTKVLFLFFFSCFVCFAWRLICVCFVSLKREIYFFLLLCCKKKMWWDKKKRQQLKRGEEENKLYKQQLKIIIHNVKNYKSWCESKVMWSYNSLLSVLFVFGDERRERLRIKRGLITGGHWWIHGLRDKRITLTIYSGRGNGSLEGRREASFQTFHTLWSRMEKHEVTVANKYCRNVFRHILMIIWLVRMRMRVVVTMVGGGDYSMMSYPIS